MTDPDLDAIRARHRKVFGCEGDERAEFCAYCNLLWPCDAIRLADALEEVEGERDELREFLASVGKHKYQCDEGWDHEKDEATEKPCSCGLDELLGMEP